MKTITKYCGILLLCCFAGCAAQTETTTTTTTSQRNSSVDTSSLDRSQNSNMQPSSYNSMGSAPP